MGNEPDAYPNQAFLVLVSSSSLAWALSLVSSQPSTMRFTWLSKNLGLLEKGKTAALKRQFFKEGARQTICTYATGAWQLFFLKSPKTRQKISFYMSD
jgi:hypothetical protein